MDYAYMHGDWTRDGLPCVTFPLQAQHHTERTIPLDVAAAAYTEYVATYGHTQSLARLGERGGFGVTELAILLYARITRLEGRSEQ